MKFKNLDTGTEFTVNNASPIIDDEMVERLFQESARLHREAGYEIIDDDGMQRRVCRAALEAALNPPQYPITEEMFEAGNKAWNKAANLRGSAYEVLSEGTRRIIRAIFTAMREVEKK